MKTLCCSIIVLITLQLKAQTVPSFEQVISLRSVGNPVISPNGKDIAYTVQTTDWSENRFDSEIWLSRQGSKPFQLTQTVKGSSTNPSFSPDGNWIAFMADRGNKTQLFAMRLAGGEAIAVTHEEEGINGFEWHPSGARFLFLKNDPIKDKKEIEKRYGGFETDDREYALTHLWQIDFLPEAHDPSSLPCYETADSMKIKAGCVQWPKAKRLTEGKFTVTSFLISPDGNYVAFGHQPDPLITSFTKSDISMFDLATGKIKSLVTNPSGDGLEDWSPDSREILYTTNLNDTTSNFYMNSRIFVLTVATGASRQLAKDLDEDVGGLSWNPSGIYFSSWIKTRRPLYRIEPLSGVAAVWLQNPEQVYGVSFSKTGDQYAYSGRNGDQLTEIFYSDLKGTGQRITDMTGQIANWKKNTSEVISWTSKDGATIEGVLHKPADYDPSRKYPLMVVIHGGPTGIDTPTPAPSYVYPMLQWLDKGCLILRPNYRGSAGYGEKFRSLNVKNLGVGDAWDVLSGIEYLNKKGMIDKAKMGCMGWSQGGYISAFLTTTTEVFKAISVGAGISDWQTYYVSTDIHPFTRQYLKATPWIDPDIYRKTSPMNYINKAKTPTLIQHGELDKRVPISNAYELLQGLRDNGVKTELIVYKGFGHGINKPKERLAATWHNWQWFNSYLWGEKVSLPIGENKK